MSEAPPRGTKRKQPSQPKQNTAVYVTGLPLDATVDEVNELFSRKCGVIAEEIDSGRPRIKLYTDAQGNFKGDALVVFFKPQSVDMAVMLLDDTDFRFSPSGLSTGKMRVQPADLSYKKTVYEETAAGGDAAAAGSSSGGQDAASGAPQALGVSSGSNNNNNSSSSNGGRNAADKQKIIKRTQKLESKLADWDDDDPATLKDSSKHAGKAQKTVILRHMFTLEELEEDPAALLDIKEDIREECAKLGEVTNVVLFDLEESGIVSVKFRTAEAAQACVDLMDGRAFDGRTVEASVAMGKVKFRMSKKADTEEHSDDE